MATQYAILRVEKLTTKGNITASGEHTFRERPTPNADATMTGQNRGIGAASSAELVEAVMSRVAMATERAKEPVLALEYLITASPEAFKKHGGQLNAMDYFNDALKWLKAKHGADNVVCAQVHTDERTPHLVAYVVPLVERPGATRKRSVVVGRNADGSQKRETREFTTPPTRALSAKHFTGGRAKLSQMQTDFHQVVGQRHGLIRGVAGSKAQHQRVKRFYGALRVAQQPVPPLSMLDGWKILQGKTPDAVKALAEAAQTAAAAFSSVQGANQAADRQRVAEAAKMAKERESLRLEREAIARERHQHKKQVANLAQGVSDLEAEASRALVKVEKLEIELKDERAKSKDLADRLAKYERPAPKRGNTPRPG